jgi:hypothetical protein
MAIDVKEPAVRAPWPRWTDLRGGPGGLSISAPRSLRGDMDRTGEAGAAPAARMVCRVATSRPRSVDRIHVRKPLRPLSHGGGDCQEVVM